MRTLQDGVHVEEPRDVPALREYLLGCWQPGGVYALTASHMRGTMLTQHDGSRPEPEFHDKALGGAALYWVSGDMCDVLNAAEKSMPDDVLLEPELLPAPCGLVVFERPLVGVDAQSETNEVRVDAMCWGPVKLAKLQEVIGGGVAPVQPLHLLDGIGMVTYSRYDADEGMNGQRLMHAIVSGALDQATVEEIIEHGPGARTMRLHGGIWAWLGRGDWLLQTPINHRETPYTEQSFRSIVEDRRRLAALWLLLAQPGIATIQEDHGSRGERRRAAREGQRPPLVRIIDVARPNRRTTAGDDGEHRHVSVRFLVSGHWRRQAYGPGRQYRRPAWIAAHWRGPEDAPVSHVEHVHVLRDRGAR